MKCHDCKIEMERIDRAVDGAYKNGRATVEIYQVYKCPRCFVEIEASDADNEE
ncbi:hypothetical protein ACFL42_00205 [Candidatus Omnitrophota bacterium]